jgi:hypothetical protein
MGIEADMEESSATIDAKPRPRGRGWSWIALFAGALLLVWSAFTFGGAVVLAPIGFTLSVVAWRRSSPHGGVFWVGFALNAYLLLGFVAGIVALVTGDASIGLE